jgi:Peptidase family C25./Propeptide_C25.
MRLGKFKQAKLLVLFMALTALAAGQPSRSFRYTFNSGMEKNSVASTDHSLIIYFSLSELNIRSVTNADGTYFRILIPGHISTSEVGKPELPVLSRLIEIPDGYYCKVRITDVRTSRMKPSRNRISGLLYPTQEGETKDFQQRRHPFTIDKTTYAARDYLRSDTVKIESVGIVRHKKLASVIISPVRYNPRTNQLSVITSMKIEITFVPDGTSASKASIPESKLFNETIGKGVLNYNPENVVPGYSDKPVKMIILTDTAFRKQIKPFVKWKTQKGFRVEVLFKGAEFAGDNFTAIKNTLANIYNSSTADNPPPEYLLIIGDVSRIPYYTSGNYTDMYYGEFDGNGDYIPDMFTGRLPAKDTTEVKTVLNKIIQYEKFAFTASNKFYDNALITAGVDGDNAGYMNGQVYYGFNNYLNPSNRINGYHFYYPASSSAKDSIIKIINKGISFLNYTGHGASDGWLYLNIKTPDIASMTNKNMYPFIISNACSTSAFYSTGSFGNKLVTTPDKGAVGFIGCSDNSYWDEDYYWAVGVGAIATDPKYETTGLGALDRLFHTHGENASDWYISMGQVNYAGNLSVSASTSSKKKYYWETYNLVGDPSVIPIIGQPDTFNIVLPDTLPDNLTKYSFISEPFSYVAISHFDTLYDASFASASGSVSLDLPGLSNDSCLMVITGQNREPLIKTIYFSNNNREFINLKSSAITDVSGNNNGEADYGESVMLNLVVSNAGTRAASGLFAKISSSSPWVSILNDSVMIGTLAAGGETSLTNTFPLMISGYVPDLGEITVDLILKDAREEKRYKIDICTHAPSLDITGFLFDDSQTGNGNYIPDPGETVNLIFNVSNFGTSSSSGLFTISSPSADLILLEPTKSSGNLAAESSTDIKVPIKLSENISIGTTIQVSTQLNCGSINVNKDFSFKVGRIQESFESSTFHAFPWINRSVIPWKISAADPYDGRIAAQSGSITHNQSSSLSIKTYYNSSDSIEFWYKVSSESGYDYLYFKLNDVIVLRKSGDVPWTKAMIYVPEGYNKMEWIYAKDGSVSSGSDMAKIDMIDFAQSGSVRYISKDILAARFISPVEKDKMGSEPVIVKLLNIAPDTIKGFNLAYTINDLQPVSQYFDQLLVPFDSVTVTFRTPADLSHYGIYNITAYSFNNNDDYLLNDTVRTNIVHTDILEPLTVCPNPFTDEFQVIINSDSVTTAYFTLINTLGLVITDFEKEISKGRNIITISDLKMKPSLYYLRIRYAGVTRSIPVIKIK